MQVLPFFFMILGLCILIIVIIELIGLILNFLPYLVIFNWIYLGTVTLKVSYNKSSLFHLTIFVFGVLLLLLAVVNVFQIIRKDIEDRYLLKSIRQVKSSKVRRTIARKLR